MGRAGRLGVAVVLAVLYGLAWSPLAPAPRPGFVTVLLASAIPFVAGVLFGRVALALALVFPALSFLPTTCVTQASANSISTSCNGYDLLPLGAVLMLLVCCAAYTGARTQALIANSQ